MHISFIWCMHCPRSSTLYYFNSQLNYFVLLPLHTLCSGRPSLHIAGTSQREQNAHTLPVLAWASLVNDQLQIYHSKQAQPPLEHPDQLIACALDCSYLSSIIYEADLYDILTGAKMQRLLSEPRV